MKKENSPPSSPAGLSPSVPEGTPPRSQKFKRYTPEYTAFWIVDKYFTENNLNLASWPKLRDAIADAIRADRAQSATRSRPLPSDELEKRFVHKNNPPLNGPPKPLNDMSKKDHKTVQSETRNEGSDISRSVGDERGPIVWPSDEAIRDYLVKNKCNSFDDIYRATAHFIRAEVAALAEVRAQVGPSEIFASWWVRVGEAEKYDYRTATNVWDAACRSIHAHYKAAQVVVGPREDECVEFMKNAIERYDRNRMVFPHKLYDWIQSRLRPLRLPEKKDIQRTLYGDERSTSYQHGHRVGYNDCRTDVEELNK